MTGHESDEDVRDELGIIDRNTIIKAIKINV
jgi:hypothetical protein